MTASRFTRTDNATRPPTDLGWPAVRAIGRQVSGPSAPPRQSRQLSWSAFEQPIRAGQRHAPVTCALTSARAAASSSADGGLGSWGGSFCGDDGLTPTCVPVTMATAMVASTKVARPCQRAEPVTEGQVKDGEAPRSLRLLCAVSGQRRGLARTRRAGCSQAQMSPLRWRAAPGCRSENDPGPAALRAFVENAGARCPRSPSHRKPQPVRVSRWTNLARPGRT